MAQSRQSYFKKQHNNKGHKKRHFIDKDTENNLFSLVLTNDQPKKVYKVSINDIIPEEDSKKFKSPAKESIQPQPYDVSSHNIALLDFNASEEGFFPKDFNKRKFSRDSANDSTSNDESYKAPIVFNKTKADNFKIKYKTELCKFFEINGTCKFGDNCAYAHGKENLRSKVTNSTAYRTRNCIQFFENGFCPYGNRCQFAHALKSNILNNPYEKNMSYSRILKTLSKKENIGNIKSFSTRPRLEFLGKICPGDLPSALFDDIKNLNEFYPRDVIMEMQMKEEEDFEERMKDTIFLLESMVDKD